MLMHGHEKNHSPALTSIGSPSASPPLHDGDQRMKQASTGHPGKLADSIVAGTWWSLSLYLNELNHHFHHARANSPSTF